MCGTSFVGSRDPEKLIWIDTQESPTHIVEIFKFGDVTGPRATKWPKVNQLLTRSILTKLTYGMGPTSQELPNQLVLQTGHRNTLAKSVPWTPNATNVASGLAAQTCQFDRPCTNLAWCSFPGEPLCQRIHLISPHKNLQDSSQRYL